MKRKKQKDIATLEKEWEKNPGKFVEDYLGLKLYAYQKVLLKLTQLTQRNKIQKEIYNMNYGNKILEILDIKPGEVFSILGISDFLYKMDENLKLYVAAKDAVDKKWTVCEDASAMNVLKGISTIRKIPQRLTPEDKIVIDYVKLCGYKYLAQDEDGEIYMYKDKPIKQNVSWNAPIYLQHNKSNPALVPYTVSFVSWSDNEPVDVSFLS